MQKTEYMMTLPYSIGGIVIHGKKLGRKLGFPTANIRVTADFDIPPAAYGVFATKVHVDSRILPGMLSIGTRPTVDASGAPPSIEVHILDFSEDIYGEHIVIDVLYKIRDEEKFSSLEALIEQMKKDEVVTRKLLA